MSGASLHRYWITIAAPIPIGFTLGCGITAFTEDDALALLRNIYPNEPSKLSALRVIQDVSIADLDANHVIPNIGDPTRRGVWFPSNWLRLASGPASELPPVAPHSICSANQPLPENEER